MDGLSYFDFEVAGRGNGVRGMKGHFWGGNVYAFYF